MVVRIPDHSPSLGQKEKDAGIWAIDFRETSPKKSDKWMYGSEKAGRNAAQVGGLAVGVPGELRGLELGESICSDPGLVPGGFIDRSAQALWQVKVGRCGHARCRIGQGLACQPRTSETDQSELDRHSLSPFTDKQIFG